jgi:hypothetical protein
MTQRTSLEAVRKVAAALSLLGVSLGVSEAAPSPPTGMLDTAASSARHTATRTAEGTTNVQSNQLKLKSQSNQLKLRNPTYKVVPPNPCRGTARCARTQRNVGPGTPVELSPQPLPPK